jgi:phosphinothricin acetyltransferase
MLPMIRPAGEADLPGILTIYNEVIINSTAVYTDSPVPLQERKAWLDARSAQRYPVLVSVEGLDVVGFASFGDFRPWPSYRHTVEHTVHVRSDRRGVGIGGRLVGRRAEVVKTVFASLSRVTLPSDLHSAGPMATF